MNIATKRQVSEALNDRHFNLAVDLGCGYGDASPILKEHCDYLIGVDKEIERLSIAGYDILYNEKIEADILSYKIPQQADAIFIFDVVEHLDISDGVKLLNRIGSRFCIVTTPTVYFPLALNGHQSLWSENLLKKLGYSTKTYSEGLIRDYLYGVKIIGVRG